MRSKAQIWSWKRCFHLKGRIHSLQALIRLLQREELFTNEEKKDLKSAELFVFRIIQNYDMRTTAMKYKRLVSEVEEALRG